MCFKKTAENVMHSKFHYEGAACVEWTETYCDDGIKMVCILMKFLSFLVNIT